MTIKSSAIRIATIFSAILIALIVIVQVIWLKRVYQLEQREFNARILNTIKGIYEATGEKLYTTAPHLSDLVSNPEPFVYFAKISLPANTKQIEAKLKEGLIDYNVFTLCQAAIYEAASNKNIYEHVIPSANSMYKTGKKFPVTTQPYDHLTLYFPNRNKYILSQMNFWVISSFSLLFILVMFSIGLYLLFRQKFLNEIQKDFIHNFTHEFKTPVAVLTLASEVLNKEDILSKPGKLKTYAGIVSDQTHYLKDHLEKLITLAATDAVGIKLNRESLSLHVIIQKALDNLQPLIDEKKAAIRTEFMPGSDRVPADKDYLKIVLINLIDNALKNAQQPQVLIRTMAGKESIAFSVSDNGSGIEKKHLKKIFKKFYRVKNEETYNSKGLGIGLSFVKEIVAAHGGTIHAKSIPGQGSTFTVSLPVY